MWQESTSHGRARLSIPGSALPPTRLHPKSSQGELPREIGARSAAVLAECGTLPGLFVSVFAAREFGHCVELLAGY